LIVGKSVIVLAAVTMALALAASVDAGSNGATVTRATLASGVVDENNVFYPATCNETQVINRNQRKETFQCTFDAAVPFRLLLVLRLRRRPCDQHSFRGHPVRPDERLGHLLARA